METIKLFVGSGEASVIERKVLIYSVMKHTKRPIDIFVFNGTHNSIEKNNEPPVLCPMPLHIKYRNVTEFSNYRWYIPQLCNFEGKAIFADSDMICLSDVGDFFDQNMGENAMLAKPNAYKLGDANETRWGMSLTLFDCSKCHFDVENFFSEIDNNLYTLTDLHQMTPQFMKYHTYKIGNIAKGWNEFDYYDEHTKLIHYTNLYTQPWKDKGHKFGDLWFTYLNEAMESGFITKEDIDKAIIRSYARKDLLKGNDYKSRIGKKNAIKQLIKEFLPR